MFLHRRRPAACTSFGWHAPSVTASTASPHPRAASTHLVCWWCRVLAGRSSWSCRNRPRWPHGPLTRDMRLGPLSAWALLFTMSLLVVVSSSSAVPVYKYSTRVIRTKYGPLRGIVVQPGVEAYLGVPYATPPLGALRYMPPVTPSLWRSTRLADTFAPVCPQRAPDITNRTEALLELPRGRLRQLERLLPLLVNQSEDCLYLNLYVPRAGKSTTLLFQPYKI